AVVWTIWLERNERVFKQNSQRLTPSSSGALPHRSYGSLTEARLESSVALYTCM
ncbi:hypothetical protein Ancab_020299, partial [Ancistrocladus abbreviatus]